MEKETGTIDYDKVEAIALEIKPKMLICGASSYVRDWDFKRFRAIADKVGAILLADISHPAGLIAKGILNDPLPYCHIVTSTTHKTLRGPRGGIIMMGKDFENPFGIKNPKGELRMMSALLDSGVFPGTQGGPLEHVIAAKAVAFGEALEDSFMDYMLRVTENAKLMASELVSKGYDLVSGGTENHCILIDLRNKDLSGKKAERLLGLCDITVNKNMVPFDDKSPFITSGIRIGTPAITTRGIGTETIPAIVNLIDQALTLDEESAEFLAIKGKVNELMSPYPLFQEV